MSWQPPFLPSRPLLEFDVLLGRGGSVVRHSGNRVFHELVNKNRRRYKNCVKNGKAGVAKEIVDAIEERGGFFVQRFNSKQAPIVGETLVTNVLSRKALDKTSQALREHRILSVEEEEAALAASSQGTDMSSYQATRLRHKPAKKKDYRSTGILPPSDSKSRPRLAKSKAKSSKQQSSRPVKQPPKKKHPATPKSSHTLRKRLIRMCRVPTLQESAAISDDESPMSSSRGRFQRTPKSVASSSASGRRSPRSAASSGSGLLANKPCSAAFTPRPKSAPSTLMVQSPAMTPALKKIHDHAKGLRHSPALTPALQTNRVHAKGLRHHYMDPSLVTPAGGGIQLDSNSKDTLCETPCTPAMPHRVSDQTAGGGGARQAKVEQTTAAAAAGASEEQISVDVSCLFCDDNEEGCACRHPQIMNHWSPIGSDIIVPLQPSPITNSKTTPRTPSNMTVLPYTPPRRVSDASSVAYSEPPTTHNYLDHQAPLPWRDIRAAPADMFAAQSIAMQHGGGAHTPSADDPWDLMILFGRSTFE